MTHHRAKRRADSRRAHDLRVQKVYGLESGEYWRIYEAQGGVCALCQRATGKAKRLAVDHDHATGRVRGLLCGPCNKFLGHGRDDAAYFRRCAEYLEQGRE